MQNEEQYLLIWLNSFVPKLTGNELNSLTELIQAPILFQIFEDISPENFTTNNEKTLENWIELLKEYNDDELNIANPNLFELDMDSLFFNPNSPDAIKIAKLVLGAAVKGNKKEDFIQGIMVLDKTTQVMMMKIIEDDLISGNTNTPKKEKKSKIPPSQLKESDYSSQMNDLDRELLEFQIKEKYDKQIDILKDDKRRSQQMLDAMGKQIKQRDVMLQSLKEDVEKYEKKNQELSVALNLEEENYRKLKEEIIKNQSISSISSPYSNQHNQSFEENSPKVVNNLKQKNQELLRQYEQCQEKLLQTENQLMKSEMQIRNLTQQSNKVRNLQDEIDILQEKVMLTKELESKNSLLEIKLSTMTKNLERKIEILNSELEKSRQTSESLKNKLNEQEKGHSDSFNLQQENINLQGKLKHALNSYSSIQQEKELLQSEFNKLQLDYNSVSRISKQQKQQNDSLNQQISLLDQQIQLLSKSNEENNNNNNTTTSNSNSNNTSTTSLHTSHFNHSGISNQIHPTSSLSEGSLLSQLTQDTSSSQNNNFLSLSEQFSQSHETELKQKDEEIIKLKMEIKELEKKNQNLVENGSTPNESTSTSQNNLSTNPTNSPTVSQDKLKLTKLEDYLLQAKKMIIEMRKKETEATSVIKTLKQQLIDKEKDVIFQKKKLEEGKLGYENEQKLILSAFYHTGLNLQRLQAPTGSNVPRQPPLLVQLRSNQN